MKLFKKKRGKFGFVFRTPISQIGKIQGVYFVQVSGFLVEDWPDRMWFTVYKSERKPKIKNLWLISLLSPVYCLWQVLVIAWFVLFGICLAFPLRIAGCLLLAASQVVVLNFKEAKHELWRLWT